MKASDDSNRAGINDAAGEAGFTKTNAFPGIEGEILVTAYHGSTYLELTVDRDGLVAFLHEENGTEIADEGTLPFREAVSRIGTFHGKFAQRG